MKRVSRAARSMGGDRKLERARRQLRATREHLRLLVSRHKASSEGLERANKQLRRARDYAEAVFAMTRHPKLLLDPGLRVRRTNRAFYEFFSEQPGQIEGRPVSAAGAGQLASNKLRALIRKARGTGAPLPDVEHEIHLPGSGRHTVLLNAKRIEAESGEQAGILLTIEDITERLQAQEAKELRDRADMQREFIANVSHELRTPVTAIRASLESIDNHADDPAAQKTFMRIIRQHSLRLEHLVEDVLRLSALEAGRRKPEPRRIAVEGFISQLVEELRPLAEHRQVRLSFRIEPGMSVWCDKTQLQTALENICENAIRYNHSGGTVKIKGRIDGGEARLTVADDGRGISRSELPHVFERFYRGRASRSSRGGLGLGLPIAKTLIEANGGRIAVSSSKGQGTTIALTLPLPKRR